MRLRSPKSASAWMAFHLAIELAAARAQAAGSRSDCLHDSMIAFACSPGAAGQRCRATRPCAPRSTGATTCFLRRESLLQRLSVFAGSWALEAAEYVGGGEALIPAMSSISSSNWSTNRWFWLKLALHPRHATACSRRSASMPRRSWWRVEKSRPAAPPPDVLCGAF